MESENLMTCKSCNKQMVCHAEEKKVYYRCGECGRVEWVTEKPKK